MSRKTRLIGVDWGTSSCRAYRFEDDGRIAERRSEPWGITRLGVGPERFADALDRLCGDWMQSAPDCPVVMAGMIGSNDGWKVAPYLGLPWGGTVDLGDLVTVRTHGGTAFIVPGLADLDGAGGVMRGEEMQVLGVGLDDDRIVLLPGTHSKWVTVAGGRVTGFVTFMTGDLYSAMRTASILRYSVGSGVDHEAFMRGVRASRDSVAGLLSDLFRVRVEAIAERMGPAAADSYLSGLIVGAEIRGGAAALAVGPSTRITICDDAVRASGYVEALKEFGLNDVVVDGDAAPRGLWKTACRTVLQGD